MDTRASGRLENLSDSELVATAREGAEEAYGLLVARHWTALLASCHKVLADGDLADDAAQQAAVEAFISLDRLRDPGRFRSWLLGIGRNLSLQLARNRSRERWSLEAIAGGRRLPEGPTPEDLAIRREVGRRVRSAVSDLPDGQRAAVRLFYLEDQGQQRAASTLGIPVGALKTRLHKARSRLRRELAPLMEERTMNAQSVELVDMRIAEVWRVPSSEAGQLPRHVVVLDEIAGDRRLPIWVGEFEASLIALQLESVRLPRPSPYDLIAGVLEAVGGKFKEARITRIAEETFYAEAVVEGTSGEQAVDSRPSDVLNLALRSGAPIRVANKVIVDAAGDQPMDFTSRGVDTATIAADAQLRFAPPKSQR
jgi:RNA polymerase sigma factor (sigma-70 family)